MRITTETPGYPATLATVDEAIAFLYGARIARAGEGHVFHDGLNAAVSFPAPLQEVAENAAYSIAWMAENAVAPTTEPEREELWDWHYEAREAFHRLAQMGLARQHQAAKEARTQLRRVAALIEAFDEEALA